MIEVGKMNGVIDKLIKKLESLEPGTEEHDKVATTLVKVLKQTGELEQVNQDAIDKAAARERNLKNDILEHNLKCEQMENERKNEVVKHIITIGTTVVTVIVTIWGVRVSLKFEEQGTITTTVGRSMFNGIINFFRKK